MSISFLHSSDSEGSVGFRQDRRLMMAKAFAGVYFFGMSAICHADNRSIYTDSKSEHLAEAERRFALRCKLSGVKIHKTIKDVDGILLLKIRPLLHRSETQFAMDDQYGNDFVGDGYIRSFLRGGWQIQSRGSPPPLPGAPQHRAYRYVEVVSDVDGVRYRYTPLIEEPALKDKRFSPGYIRFSHERTVAAGKPPRYAVDFTDISTLDDRKYWIAGSSLRVIDTLNHEVIAERIGYMMDIGQGARGGGRAPWLLAASNACPAFKGRPPQQSGQTEEFVESVLIPTP